jgi:hypothetical protein
MLFAGKETDPMWQGLKTLWKIWTIDKPAALGDWLWDVLVVQFAAFLDRLTLRHVAAFIPLVILIMAYLHGILIPPELMLIGDITAYLDIFSLLLLIGVLTRISTIVFAMKQATARATRLITALRRGQRRLDTRHRRMSVRRRSIKDGNTDDDRYPAICGVAWA